MPLFRKKSLVVDAVQWFKDGDHDAVEPRPAVVRFDRSENYFYVDHGEPSEANMRPTAWLAVDRSSEVAKKNGEALPFAMYEIKSWRVVPVRERPDLLAVYAADHSWERFPRDFGILIAGKDKHDCEVREMVASGDWIVTHGDGRLSVSSPEDFAATYEAVQPSDTGEQGR